MQKLAAAIQAFLSRVTTRLVTTMQRIGGSMVAVTQSVVEAVPAAAGGVGQALDAVVSSPFRLAASVFGGRGGQAPTPQSVAQAAAADERGVQAQASERTQERQLLRAIRSVALARADGAPPDAVLVATIPAPVLAYLDNLELSECRALASRSTSDVRALLEGRSCPGVRTPEQVAQAPVARNPEPAPAPPAPKFDVHVNAYSGLRVA